jgi:WD40 repeat protein
MQDKRSLLPAILAGISALLAVAIVGPETVVISYLPSSVTRYRVAWVASLIVITIALVMLAVWLGRQVQAGERRRGDPSVPAVDGWIDRPELGELVVKLTAPVTGAVAATTGLIGPGGFGKTTLARKASHERAVRRRYGKRIYEIQLEQDLEGPLLTQQISQKIRRITGREPQPFDSPEEAGAELADELAKIRRPTLLILDDVWTDSQLAAFQTVPKSARLLITTRVRTLMMGTSAQKISVGSVTDDVARAMLERDLFPPIPHQDEARLLRLTGNWPLLLGIVNGRLKSDAETGATITAAADEAIANLSRDGPAALDVNDSGSRRLAVAATINYSLDLFKDDDKHGFYELGVFPENADIPVPLIAGLWAEKLGHRTAQRLCDDLVNRSLISKVWKDGHQPVIKVHSVVRAFLIDRLGSDRQQVHRRLVSVLRELSGLAAGAGWWRAQDGAESGYLWAHLGYHLHQAGLQQDLDDLCSDLRFAVVKLLRTNAAELEADLARSTRSTATSLRAAVAQNAHVLGPLEPPLAIATTLTSRLGAVSAAASQLPAVRSDLHAWTAWPARPLPDQPSEALIRMYSGQSAGITRLAISPDGAWLAAGDTDGAPRIWLADGTPVKVAPVGLGQLSDLAIAPHGGWLCAVGATGLGAVWWSDGSLRATLSDRTGSGHTDRVNAVAIAPGEGWIVTVGEDKKILIWSPDGDVISRCPGHPDEVVSVTIGPDGTWFATAGFDGTIRIWSAAGALIATTTGRYGQVTALAAGPDNARIYSGGMDGAGRIWSVNGGAQLAEFSTRHEGQINAIAVAPDGSWVGTASDDKTARIWSPAGQLRATLSGHTDAVYALAIAPDATWMVTGACDDTARTWSADGSSRAVLAGHGGSVRALAISSGQQWLASGGRDGIARAWSAAVTPELVSASYVGPVATMAVAPDGTWLATATSDGTVQVWAAEGTTRTELLGHSRRVNAIAIASDGTWLVTASEDGTAITWTAAGVRSADLSQHEGAVYAVAVSADRQRIVTGGSDGTARIWTPGGQPLLTLPKHPASVRSVAVASAGEWLVTGCDDGTARIWAADGSPRAALRHARAPGDIAITAISIAPNGQWIAIAGNDGKVQLWSAEGAWIKEITGHTDRVTAVAIDHSSTRLATASNDQTARVIAGVGAVSMGAAQINVTSIRVDGWVSACAWLPGGSDLVLAGAKGVYWFSVQPPDTDGAAS